LSNTQAKHLLHDSVALQQKEAESPPRELSLSTSVKGIPDRANSRATVIPEIPPPMIRTSLSVKFPILIEKVQNVKSVVFVNIVEYSLKNLNDQNDPNGLKGHNVLDVFKLQFQP
jgi:hypothetical protein